MKITNRTSSIRTLRHNDAAFTIVDGMITAPRAGFEIDKHCPDEYKLIISQCINYGWLKPVANISERELLFIGLSTKECK